MPDTRSVRQVIPLFPLEYVLLPGLPLPLHIFEPRYRQLIADVAPEGEGGSFGVVLGTSIAADQSLTARPPATGTGPCSQHSVADIGTLAEIVENEPYADGRCDLLTVGSRRFVIHSVDDSSRPYLQADVEFLDEADGVLEARTLALARELSAQYGTTLERLTGIERGEELAHDLLRASYEIAGRLQLTSSDRQGLLACITSADRLTAEVALLRRELAILHATRAVPVPVQSLHVPSSRN
jgi:Lon protease-like protein